MTLLVAALLPLVLQIAVLLQTQGAAQPAWSLDPTWDPTGMLGVQLTGIALSLAVLWRQFSAWTAALAVLWVPGMLTLLRYVELPMIAWLGYGAPR
ncbi:MAG: hypothetical protein AB7N65_13805 [Vicinamibacterales bacterium]